MQLLIILLLAVLTCAGPLCAESTSTPVDFDKARQIMERMKTGGTVTEEEKAYLDRAKAERGKTPPRAMSADGIDWPKAQALLRREQRGEELTTDEQAYLARAKEARRRSVDRQAPLGQRQAPGVLKPLSDIGAGETYEGEDGGLYGGGNNTPPAALVKSATAVLDQIKPIDGRIVLVSISMSNATMEFATFRLMADADARKSGKLTIVDCAQGGQAMAEWVDPEGASWKEAMLRIERAGVTPAQVQVAWIKLANKNPGGSMKDHLGKLEADTTEVLHNAKSRFPNLRITYLGSRIWAGNAKGGLNPEPYAYESAFGVRHLIQQQMKGEPALAPEKAPLLLWGPYLWAEGTQGRKLDDLKWEPQDFAGDGVHPSQSGREKVARQLLEFFAGNALAKSWFAQ